MVKAVIFDMDGVLIDTEKYLNLYWRQAAQEAGFTMTYEHALQIRSLAAKYAGPYLQSVFGAEFDYEKIRARRKELMNAQLAGNGIEKKPGVDAILDCLHRKGIKAAVATATDEVRATAYLSEIGIYEKFDRVICATMVANGKPAPDIYLYACEQIGERPQDCIAVEDSPNGIKAASSAGLHTVMVPDLTQPTAEDWERIEAKVDSLEELAERIEKGEF